MKKIYFFYSNAIVFNDKFIPVVLELARQGHPTRTVLMDAKSRRRFDEVYSYARWLEKLTRVVRVSTGREGVLAKCLAMFNFLRLALDMLVSRDYLAFFDDKKTSWLFWLLTRIAKARGRSLLFTGYHLDMYPGFDEEAAQEQNKAEMHKVARRRKVARFREKSRDKECDAVIFYHQDQLPKLRHFRCDRAVILHHPKMQSWWREFLRQCPPEYDNPVVARAESFISVFLTHQGNYFFAPGSDLDVLLAETIRAVRAAYPDTLIVVKPKTTVDKDFLDRVLAGIGDKNLTLTTTPVALLAMKSLFGITTCHTSAQFEFMCHGKPWLEYCRYSDFWKGYYPDVTCTVRFGGVWAETLDELMIAVSAAEAGAPAVMDNFKRIIGFQEQPLDISLFE